MDVSVQFRTLTDKIFKTQQNIADHLGFKKAFINGIYTGNDRISASVILRIAERCPQVNIDWLIHGRGPMLWELGSDNTILNMVEESAVDYTTPDRKGNDLEYKELAQQIKELQRVVAQLSK